jgi:DNA-binding response OmpR family regulator
MKALVLEDDPKLRGFVAQILGGEGYAVDHCTTGADALRLAEVCDYDFIVLDWVVPDFDGLSVCREIRRSGVVTPILMLSARGLVSECILGLETGADDYMVKPFDFPELLARLRALRRRPAKARAPRLSLGDLVYEPATRAVRAGGMAIGLTQTELGILEILLQRSPAVVTRRAIAVQVWQEEADAVGSNTIDVHVARLRSKLSAAQIRIETHRGVGYRLLPT